MTSLRSIRLWLSVAAALSLFAPTASAEVVIDWVTVGDPGNACEIQSQGCFGAVAEPYRISKFEVTNAQYAEFLNAVAVTDTNALYSTNMGSGFGGITRSGSSGSYSYSAIAPREDMPVNHVSFYDSLSFANWLHNGQPTGAQDSTTTEGGAYDMSLGSSVVRNAGATVFLTSDDEWYKSAYYKGGGTSAGYWDYPAGSDTQTTCTVPGATSNTANCDVVAGDLTDGGSYTGSPSPSGSFDQGGNVAEWMEAIIAGGSLRAVRGGGFGNSASTLAASIRIGQNPVSEFLDVGFRVASLVPKSIPGLSPPGIAILLILLGATAYLRLKASPSSA